LVKNEEKFINLDDSKHTNKTLNKGLNIKNLDLEHKFINFIEINWKLFNPITI